MAPPQHIATITGFLTDNNLIVSSSGVPTNFEGGVAKECPFLQGFSLNLVIISIQKWKLYLEVRECLPVRRSKRVLSILSVDPEELDVDEPATYLYAIEDAILVAVARCPVSI